VKEITAFLWNFRKSS